MPKKTRKEKLLAQARRIVRQQLPPEPQPGDPVTGTPTNDHTAYRFRASQPATARPAPTGTKTEEFTAVRRDLAKTVFLSVAVLMLELLIIWQMKG